MEWYASLAIGLFMMLFGGGYIFRHLAAARSFRDDSDLSPKQRKLLVAQQKRRLFTSALVILTGLLVPALAYSIEPLRNKILATVLLCALLLLLLIIVALALGDMVSSRSFREDIDLKRAESELKKRVLEQELERHQERKSDLLKKQTRGDNGSA